MPAPGYGGTLITSAYTPRTYRHWVSDADLVSYSARVEETDLLIRTRHALTQEALAAIRRCRIALESYIREHPLFAVSLVPISVDDYAPELVKAMASAADQAGVGPMAAVAGAIAEDVGRSLLSLSEEAIVENGGDIFLRISRTRLVGLYAGKSRLTGRIAFEINPEDTPLGVCTSSRSVGHSLSFGQADAVVAFAPSTPLADAAGTAIANRVLSAEAIAGALEFAQSIPGLTGAVVVVGNAMGIWGKVKIAQRGA